MRSPYSSCQLARAGAASSCLRQGKQRGNARAHRENLIKILEEDVMTLNVSRRSLLALGAGLGASTLLGGTAQARAPKLGTQTPYWHRFVLGDAEVTVESDGPLPLGPPK